tara:strand:+ start:181 stop:456 length:276 start_codon:yes stop_codon:yes gene_type:complete
MGFWTKALGIDKRFMKIEDMLTDVRKHQQKIDMKMDILAHDVVGHLPSVPSENKINNTYIRLQKLEEYVQSLASSIIEIEAITKIKNSSDK